MGHRLRSTSRALLFALLMLAPGFATAAPPLRVAIPDGFDCPTADQLRTALAKRIDTATIAASQPPGGEASLSLTRLPESVGLDLRYMPSGIVTRRVLALGQGTCADLAETIALIADGWLRELPRRTATALEAAKATSSGPPPAAATGGHTALSLRLGGGALLGNDASVGPEGTLAVDLGIFRGLGTALFFSILENAGNHQTLSDGSRASVTVGRQTAALAARYAFATDSDNGPRVFAGLALEILEAGATGYLTDRATAQVVPAGFVAALWQQRIWRSVFAYAQLAASVGSPIEIQVQSARGAQTVQSLPAAEVDISAGLGLRLF